MEDQLLEYIGRFSYAAVFALLAAAGIGLPVPEDMILLSAGVVTSTGRALLPAMILVAAAGVLTADTLLFRIGARLGPKLMENQRLKKVLTPARVAKVKARFDRYGAWTIFIARFLPGVRMPTFLLSGTFGVSQRRFWLADGLAVCIFAPTMVFIGFQFGAPALPYVRRFGGWALLILAAVALIAFAVSKARARVSPGA